MGWEDPLEEAKAAHSSILAWRTPWTEEPGGLYSIRSHRVGHDWSDLTYTHTDIHTQTYTHIYKHTYLHNYPQIRNIEHFQPSRNFFHSLSQASFPHRQPLLIFIIIEELCLLWNFISVTSHVIFYVWVLLLNTLFLRIDHTAHSSLLLSSIPLYKYTKFVYPFFCELFGLFGLFSSSYYYEYNCYDLCRSLSINIYFHVFCINI